MKNNVLIIVVLLLLGAGGYFYLSSRGMMPKAPVSLPGSQTGGNVFTSIKDALSKSLSLKCVYKDEKGIETTTYLKGGSVRVMMTNASDDKQPNNIIMKDMMMYMWSDTTKTGFTYKLEKPEEITPFPTLKESADKNTSEDQKESVLAEIEKYKDACKAEVVADSMFAVPSDVKFQDMSALQEQMMKGLPQAQPSVAADGEQTYDADSIQQMLQQQGAGE